MSLFQPNSTLLRVLSPHVRIGANINEGVTPSDNTIALTPDGHLDTTETTLVAAAELASLAGTVLGAYHGFKRNNSVGWAIGWAILGGLFPIVVIPVAYAQGIGKRA